MNKYSKEYIDTFCELSKKADNGNPWPDVWNEIKQTVHNAWDSKFDFWKGVGDWGNKLHTGYSDWANQKIDDIGTGIASNIPGSGVTFGKGVDNQTLANTASVLRHHVLDSKNLGFDNFKQMHDMVQSGAVAPGQYKPSPLTLPSANPDTAGMIHSVAVDRARDNVARESAMYQDLENSQKPTSVLYKGTAPGTTYRASNGGSAIFLKPGAPNIPDGAAPLDQPSFKLIQLAATQPSPGSMLPKEPDLGHMETPAVRTSPIIPSRYNSSTYDPSDKGNFTPDSGLADAAKLYGVKNRG